MGIPIAVGLHQRHVQPARVAGVQHSKTVTPWLNVQMWPYFTVDQHGIAEELRNPKLMRPSVGHRIEKAAIGIEQAILEHQGYLKLIPGNVQSIFDPVANEIHS